MGEGRIATADIEPGIQARLAEGWRLRVRVKRFLEDFATLADPVPENGLHTSRQRSQYRRRIRDLRESLEAWANAFGEEDVDGHPVCRCR